jgi:EAL domain-containing protein (putative c-di-GMP-specific phosphodiesterase class I)
MLREADTAMYRAKTRGAGKVELFDASVTPEVADRFQVAQDLRSALLADQLTVFYQPVITLADGALAGCEALVRWRHPDHGCLLPERFIEIAESSGLIVPLGQQVLEIACAQTQTWRATQPQMIVSVNVSRRQLVEPGFVDLVTNVLKEAGIPGEAICLEITETSTPIRDEVLDEVLHDVRALGVRIALDDFGSGYSTLANLRRLPIDLIKIDRIFTAGLAASAADRGIVRSVLSLARELNVTVVAEGVETPEQLAILRGLGCRFAQGYLFAAPAPPEVLLEEAALAAWRAACSRS